MTRPSLLISRANLTLNGTLIRGFTKIFNVEYQKVSGTQMVLRIRIFLRAGGEPVPKLAEEFARMRERADKLGTSYTRKDDPDSRV